MKKSFTSFVFVLVLNVFGAVAQTSPRELDKPVQAFLNTIAEGDKEGFYSLSKDIKFFRATNAFEAFTDQLLTDDGTLVLMNSFALDMEHHVDWAVSRRDFTVKNAKDPDHTIMRGLNEVKDPDHVIMVYKVKNVVPQPQRSVLDLLNVHNWESFLNGEKPEYPNTDIFHPSQGFEYVNDDFSEAFLSSLIGEGQNPSNFIIFFLKKDPRTGQFNIGMPPTLR
ncbi:MAG: hypothetical protein AAF598_12080 [Bacteroidota bacterium]